MIITIDGPTASGKSTIGRMLAHKLNAYYLCSGLLFRAIAYVLKEQYGYSKEQFETPRLEDICEILDTRRLVYSYEKGNERVLFDGTDITAQLKDVSIDWRASLLGINSMVRAKLARVQQDIARDRDVVVDGRDAGSVVFPNAEYKFYITASREERARRWHRMQEKNGRTLSFSDARAIIQERDTRDEQRKVSPLIVPLGAHVVDTTKLSINEVLEHLLRVINKRSVFA